MSTTDNRALKHPVVFFLPENTYSLPLNGGKEGAERIEVFIMKRVIVVLHSGPLHMSERLCRTNRNRQKDSQNPLSKPAVVKPVQPLEPKAPYEAYAVADAADGKVLEGLNVNQRWPQASLTKLMLALVVVDKLDRGELRLDERVTASKNAEGMGGSQVFLKAGENFTLDELMQAALVESANDAAYAVAEHAAGSADEFVQQMNRKAQALGMLDTEFHCVHGLPPAPGGPDNLTTCSDLIRLARAALAHPRIIAWTSIEQTTFRNGTLLIQNKNKLVGRMPGSGRPENRFYPKGRFQHRGHWKKRRPTPDRSGAGEPRSAHPGQLCHGEIQRIPSGAAGDAGEHRGGNGNRGMI